MIDLKKRMRSNRSKELKMGEYLNIAIITFCEYSLPELEIKIDSALRKENLPWGAAKVHIRKTDPSVNHVNNQFQQTKFAGICWVTDLDSLFDCHCLLVVGQNKKHRDKFEELSKKFTNLRRRRYIDV